MTEFDEVCNIAGLLDEPRLEDMGYCRRCDCDIPESADDLCAVCAECEEVER